MLPEVGATEYLIIAIVALIVVGPKDLPVLLRRLGQFVAKLRGMASEFRASFDEMARQSELDELRKEVEAMRRGQFADMASHEAEMRSTVSEIETSLSDVGVQLHPPMSYQYDTHQEPPEAPPLQISEAPAKPKRARKPRAAKPKVAANDSAPAVETPKKRKPRARKTAGAGS
jgi:sec-independent protein translocase protein TatB